MMALMHRHLTALLIACAALCGCGGSSVSSPIPEAQAAVVDQCPIGDATVQLQAMADTARGGRLDLPACTFNISALRISKPLAISCASPAVDGTVIRYSADEGVVVDPDVVVSVATGGWDQRGYWFSMRGCRIKPQVKGGGKHDLVLRARLGFFISSSLIEGNHFGGSGEQGLFLDNSAGNPSGGIFTTRVVGNFIEGGVLCKLCGDSVQFIDNVVPDRAGSTNPTPGFDLSFISGAAESSLVRNNITTTGGCIVIRNGVGVGIEHNWCESSSAGQLAGLIHLINCAECTVRDNRVQTLSGDAPYALVLDGGELNVIDSNKLNVGKAGHMAFINGTGRNKLAGLNRFIGADDVLTGKITGAATGLIVTP